MLVTETKKTRSGKLITLESGKGYLRTDDEKKAINSGILDLFEKTLADENSFAFPFDSLEYEVWSFQYF